jgi:hypothetical protein
MPSIASFNPSVHANWHAHEILTEQHCSVTPEERALIMRILTVALCIFGVFLIMTWPPLIIPPCVVLVGMAIDNIWNRICT